MAVRGVTAVADTVEAHRVAPRAWAVLVAAVVAVPAAAAP